VSVLNSDPEREEDAAWERTGIYVRAYSTKKPGWVNVDLAQLLRSSALQWLREEDDRAEKCMLILLGHEP
jgi:hypothetical protein